jgi:tetratricopeptide (TPR) repeat protein
LTRGHARLAGTASPADSRLFTLRVTRAPDGRALALSLLAPDGAVEREQRVPLVESATRLATLRALAAQLPGFLGLAPGAARAEPADWAALIGTADAAAYDTFLSGALPLLGPAGQGYTQPAMTLQRPHAVERLERLTRREPRFARAWAALALAYLSLGGEDESSLLQLAQASAERALSLDAQLATTHAALGLVHLRRGEWIEAHEQLERALALDREDAAALEGAGCLRVDAGHYRAARPLLEQVIELQPGNVGAQECHAYTLERTSTAAKAAGSAISPGVARVRAATALLDGDTQEARRWLRSALDHEEFADWAAPVLRAAGNPRRIAGALQAITRAANDGRIDATTEILCGAALRQAEFVFNRMSRLQREDRRVPLRVLWLTQSTFLRRHPGFEQLTRRAGLPAFWQHFGTPDVCANDAAFYGCELARTRQAGHGGQP